jgi:hypothetical protein
VPLLAGCGGLGIIDFRQFLFVGVKEQAVWKRNARVLVDFKYVNAS